MHTQASPLPAAEPPLAVDLDGTLIRTDLLLESIVRLARANPLALLLLPFWLLKGRQVLKLEVARRVHIDNSLLPYNEPFVAYLRQQREAGRKLVLATAAQSSQAEGVARFLGLFDEVLASDETHNLAGHHKRDALVQRFGDKGFDYAGNARPDLAIWPHARQAVVVNAGPGVEAHARRLGNVAEVFPPERRGWRTLVRAIRVHQWLKNFLVGIPLVAAHQWAPRPVLLEAAAFIAFSFCASAIYLLNDAFDLDADRAHPRKRKRPLAAGDLQLPTAVLMFVLLLVAGFTISAFLPLAFSLTLAAYVAVTLSYSLVLKAYVLIDVVSLAVLYTLRVIAGAAAISVVLSFWLLAFSMFIFASLALVKRCSELQALADRPDGATRGRDYRVADLRQLTGLGTSCANGAVIILALYINSPDVVLHYRNPNLLWLLCPLLMYWSGRMWIKCGRGEMHDDPVVYAARDRASLILVVTAGVLVLLAT